MSEVFTEASFSVFPAPPPYFQARSQAFGTSFPQGFFAPLKAQSLCVREEDPVLEKSQLTGQISLEVPKQYAGRKWSL